MRSARSIISALLCAASLAGPARIAMAAGQVGDPAPSYTLTGLDGLTYTGAADLGKVVFIFLFGYS